MAYPDSTTLGPAYGMEVSNVALSVAPTNLTRKTAFLAQYDSAMTDVVDYVPKPFLSAEQVGEEMGWGSPAHRMAIRYFRYGAGVALWLVPVPEAGGATAKIWTVTITVTTAEAGTIPLYIGDELYAVPVTAGMTAEAIAAAVKTVIDADPAAPVDVSVATNVATLTSKALGTYANDYLVETLYEADQAIPGGVTVAIAGGTDGATDPALDNALAGMGTDSESNKEYFTDCVTSNGKDQTSFTACSEWNGVGNTPTGNHAPSVMRPTRFFSVDTTPGTGGYDALVTLADANRLDRTNILIAAPDHKVHPVELAAEIAGFCAAVAQAHPHQSYVNGLISGHVGDSANRWTKNDTSREAAIKNGIATTKVVDGVLTLDGIVTMYRPSTVAVQNNSYRSARNVACRQNVTAFHRQVHEPNKNRTIVDDLQKVDAMERETCIDIDGVEDLNNRWADGCEAKAWIYQAEMTKKTQKVTVRDLANGFDHEVQIVYSGEGVVSNTRVKEDISLAIFQG